MEPQQHQDQNIQSERGNLRVDDPVANAMGCGFFQVFIVITTYSTQLCVIWGMLFMAFGNYHSDWRCSGHLNSVYNVSNRNYTVTTNFSRAYAYDMTSATGGSLSNETKDDVTENGTDNDRTASFSCSVLSSCKSVEFDEDSSTIVTEWCLICDYYWVQSVIICVQMLGVLFGAYFSGFIGDRFGRKISLYGSLAIHAVANSVAIASVSWEMFAAVRFVIGLCIGGVLATYFTYPVEFLKEKWRGVLGAIPMWNLGAASFSVLVFFVRDWRHIHLATAIFSALLFIPVFWVPESLRWLAVHGKVNRAKQIATMASGMNRRPVLDTAVLENLAREVKRTTTRSGQSNQYSLLNLFKIRSLRKTSIAMSVIWISLAMVYYGISFGIKTLSGDFFVNFIIFSVAEFPGMIFVAPTSNRLGRRLASVIYFLFMALACLAIVPVNFVAPDYIRGTAITVLAILAKMHMLAVWMIVTVYCTELYPTVIRNLGIGYLNSCARIGGIVAPYLIPNTSDFLFVCYLIMGVVLLACCFLLLSLPETKGRPLEDILDISSCPPTNEEAET